MFPVIKMLIEIRSMARGARKNNGQARPAASDAKDGRRGVRLLLKSGWLISSRGKSRKNGGEGRAHAGRSGVEKTYPGVGGDEGRREERGPGGRHHRERVE